MAWLKEAKVHVAWSALPQNSQHGMRSSWVRHLILCHGYNDLSNFPSFTSKSFRKITKSAVRNACFLAFLSIYSLGFESQSVTITEIVLFIEIEHLIGRCCTCRFVTQQG